jgi:hypothetical protein
MSVREAYLGTETDEHTCNQSGFQRKTPQHIVRVCKTLAALLAKLSFTLNLVYLIHLLVGQKMLDMGQGVRDTFQMNQCIFRVLTGGWREDTTLL